jgi:organic radical activating enzyme
MPDLVDIASGGTTSTERVATLPVVEHFHSIQGEGTRVGEVATFIRLAGCNLRCSWCDTPYSWNAEGMRAAGKLAIDDVADLARERAVVITGGEPMLHARHLPRLVAALRGRGVEHVTVETNATVVPTPELLAAVDLWSLSPKLAGSGEPFPTATLAALLDAAFEHDGDLGRCQLKLVCAELPGDWNDLHDALDAARTELQGRNPQAVAAWRALPVLVQPDGLREDYADAIRELAELVVGDERLAPDGRARRDGVRVVPQVHRIAWGARARGV